jgi:hypothetical protein
MCLEEGDCSKNIGGLHKFKLNPKDSDPNLPIHFFRRNKKNSPSPKGSRVTSSCARPKVPSRSDVDFTHNYWQRKRSRNCMIASRNKNDGEETYLCSSVSRLQFRLLESRLKKAGDAAAALQSEILKPTAISCFLRVPRACSELGVPTRGLAFFHKSPLYFGKSTRSPISSDCTGNTLESFTYRPFI